MKNKKLYYLLYLMLFSFPLLAQESQVTTLWEQWLKPFGLGAGVLVIVK